VNDQQSAEQWREFQAVGDPEDEIEHWATQVRLECLLCNEWKPYPDLADFHAPSDELCFQCFICDDCIADLEVA